MSLQNLAHTAIRVSDMAILVSYFYFRCSQGLRSLAYISVTEPIACWQSLILDKAMLLSSFLTNSSPECFGGRAGTFDGSFDSKSISQFTHCFYFLQHFNASSFITKYFRWLASISDKCPNRKGGQFILAAYMKARD